MFSHSKLSLFTEMAAHFCSLQAKLVVPLLHRETSLLKASYNAICFSSFIQIREFSKKKSMRKQRQERRMQEQGFVEEDIGLYGAGENEYDSEPRDNSQAKEAQSGKIEDVENGEKSQDESQLNPFHWKGQIDCRKRSPIDLVASGILADELDPFVIRKIKLGRGKKQLDPIQITDKPKFRQKIKERSHRPPSVFLKRRAFHVKNALEFILDRRVVDDPKLYPPESCIEILHLDLKPDLRNAVVAWRLEFSRDVPLPMRNIVEIKVQEALEKNSRLLTSLVVKKVKMKYAPILRFRVAESLKDIIPQQQEFEAMLSKLINIDT